MNREQNGMHRIVVVGGGAGGLELVTRLGHALGKHGRAHVTLIEKARTHFWKPHLHEIAAGSMDINSHAIDYLAQSHWHGFRYRLGAMVGLDRERREVQVAPVLDDEGRPIGLYVEAGRERHKINLRPGPGNFHMLPNGVFAAEDRKSVV